MLLIKKMFGLPSVIINSFTASRRDCAYHLSQAMKIEDKIYHEKTKKQMPQHDGQADKLLEELSTNSMSKLLICLQSKHINGSHIVAAVRSYFKYCSKLHSEFNQISIDVTREEYFKQISLIVNLNLSKATTSEVLQIINFYFRLGIPFTSNIFEPLFTRVYINVEDLSLVEYNQLASRISKFTNVPIIKKILHQLQQTFITKMSLEFDENSIEHLENTLSFISKQLWAEPDLFEITLNKLESFNGDISVNTSLMILDAISRMLNYFEPSWHKPIQRMKNIISQNIDRLNMYQINYFFLAMSVQHSHHICPFYDKDLIDKLIERVLFNDPGFDLALSNLKSLGYMRHRSIELMNYICACYFEKRSVSMKKIPNEYGKLLILIYALSNAKHKPNFWYTFRDLLLDNSAILEKIESVQLHRTVYFLAFHLVNLECCHPSILKKIFQQELVFCTDDRENDALTQWSLLKIYQMLKTTDDYNGPLPKKSLIESFPMLLKKYFLFSKSVNSNLRSHLIKGLGGSAYVKSEICTKLFHSIDHMVVFDNNNDPVPIVHKIKSKPKNPEDFEYLEDLKFPPDSQVVLLINVQKTWYYRNCDQTLSNFGMIFETLEKMIPRSYSILRVNLSVWEGLSSEKKTLYIMEQVRLKLK